MKKILSLLSVLTISGTAIPTTIAASPYQKEETIKNNDNNYQQTNNLKILKRNKRSNDYEYGSFANSNRKIKFYGYGDWYKGEINLNSYNSKIEFKGNSDYFHRYFNGGYNTKYLQISIFDQHGIEIKNIEIGTRDWMEKVIEDNNLKNGIHYQNGYIIKIYSKEPWRTWFNIGNENNWKRFAFIDSRDWDWEWKYRIDNDNIVNYYNYDEKIKLLDINDRYSGEVGLDTNNKRIMFFGNNNFFNESFENINYNKIIIKNQVGKEIKKIIINGDESMREIINKYNLKNGINYQDGYIIEVWTTEPQRTHFVMNEHNNYRYYVDLNPRLDKFILINNKLLTFNFYQKEHFGLLLEWQANFNDWKNEINRQIKKDLSTFTVEQKRSWKGNKINELKDKIFSLKQTLQILDNRENINKLTFKIQKLENDFNYLKNKVNSLTGEINSNSDSSLNCANIATIAAGITSGIPGIGTIWSAVLTVISGTCAIIGV